jgi:hypothetical protein
MKQIFQLIVFSYHTLPSSWMVTLFVEGFNHFTGITQLCSNSNHLNFHLLKQGGISSTIFLLVCIKLIRVQHTNSTDLKICNICMTHQLPHCGFNWWTMFCYRIVKGLSTSVWPTSWYMWLHLQELGSQEVRYLSHVWRLRIGGTYWKHH